MCVDAKTHVTVSVPTLAVCLMLSESEAEHARLTVLGANVRVCVCVKEGRNWVSGNRGERRIRRQRGRQQSRLNLHILCPQLVYEEYNKQRLTPPSGK